MKNHIQLIEIIFQKLDSIQLARNTKTTDIPTNNTRRNPKSSENGRYNDKILYQRILKTSKMQTDIIFFRI